MESIEEKQSTQYTQPKQIVRIPVWFASLMLLLTLAVLFAALYLQFTRYRLVARAIDMRDATTSALLLSPEIATGLVKLF